jgi:hypothetical protein
MNSQKSSAKPKLQRRRQSHRERLGSLIGGVLLILMVVHLTGAAGLPLWASFGLVGALLVGASVYLLMRAKKTATDIHVVPLRTVQTMKENMSWIKEEVTSARTSEISTRHKLKLLEQRVQEAALGTKSGVRQIVGHIRHTAKEFVDGTTQKFDPIPQVCEHPWAMISGAIVVGFGLGKLESQVSSGQRESSLSSYALADVERADMPAHATRGPLSQSKLCHQVRQEISGEIEQAKHAAIEAGRSVVHDLFQRTLPAMGESVLGRSKDRSADSPRISLRN